MPHIFVLDNYDSFTYNLVQYIEQCGARVTVALNDHITLDDIQALQPDGIVISPGPGNPSQAGCSLSVIEAFHQTHPILGVCLGHQCLGQFFGGKIIQAKQILHGKLSDISHNNQGLFEGIDNPMQVTRYHSLVIDPDTLPACLHITATDEHGEIMAIQHQTLPLFGVQFHPESILTLQGMGMIKAFVNFL